MRCGKRRYAAHHFHGPKAPHTQPTQENRASDTGPVKLMIPTYVSLTDFVLYSWVVLGFFGKRSFHPRRSAHHRNEWRTGLKMTSKMKTTSKNEDNFKDEDDNKNEDDLNN